MSHQVLARKWRPQSFNDLVGQTHVVQALSNALSQGRLHHGYLLTGTRGVGKTTIARILARCFNCETGVSATPCGECSSCCEITEGRSLDLIEIDAASRTKVEEMRELLENVQFVPTHSRYKIYLIDEVHMLSNSSFNALLKTLEEPPPHVIFIFATTHPQKIPPTVLSRCLQFHLKNLAVDLIVEHLQYILSQEQVDSEAAALRAIAHAAAGSMRDALSLTDQAIAHGDGQIKEAAVSAMLGAVDHQVIIDLVDAIVDENAALALQVIAAYVEQASDLNVMADELLSLFHRIVVEQVVPAAGAEGQFYAEAIARYAKQLAPEEVQIFYQTVLNGKRDMAYAPEPITGLEMIILRLLAFRQIADDEGFAAQVVTAPVVDVEKVDAVKVDTAQVNAAKVATATENPPEKKPINKTAEINGSAKASQQLNSEPNITQAASAEPIVAATVSDSELPELDKLNNSQWCQIFSTLPLSGVVRSVASNCVFSHLDTSASEIVVQLFLQQTDALLYKPEHQQRVAKGLSIYYGQNLTVEVSTVATWQAAGLGENIENPAMYKTRKQAQLHDETVKVLEGDENIKALVDVFDARLDLDSIQVDSSTES